MIVLADIGVLASPRETWEAWSPEPTLLAAIVFVGVLYGRGVRVATARSVGARTKTVARAWAYYAGLLALGLALASPLDAFAGVLFSLHMVQHLVLIAVAAPLLVFGRPLRIAFLAIPRRLRGVVTRVTTRGRARGVLVRIVDPRLALVVHVLVLTMWHWPPIYASALRRPELHALEHAAFLGASVLLWESIRRPRFHPGLRLFVLFAAATQGVLLGAAITLAPAPWYPLHAAGARAWGLSPLDDQRLAGLVMWVPGGVSYLLAALWVVVQSFRSAEASSEARTAWAPWSHHDASARRTENLLEPG